MYYNFGRIHQTLRVTPAMEAWQITLERRGIVGLGRVDDRMRIAVLIVALFTVLVGVMGIVSPDSVTTVRRLYFATPAGLYTAAAVRMAMGLVVILFAPHSRTPRTLRALGAVMCMQALSATLLGPERARAVLEWEGAHSALLRGGAVVALAAGGFLVFAVAAGRRPLKN